MDGDHDRYQDLSSGIRFVIEYEEGSLELVRVEGVGLERRAERDPVAGEAVGGVQQARGVELEEATEQGRPTICISSGLGIPSQVSRSSRSE